MSEQHVLECRSVVRRFREGSSTLEVLSGVDLVIEKGERLAIVGASGSGKTTLLQIMGGLDDPTSGEVIVSGQSLANTSERKKGELRNQYIGFVYQFHHLLADFTALENVAMPLMIGGAKVADAKQAAKALLDKVGLSHRMQHRPSELSGGERQRVAIARALVNKPDLVLADEPTGNLDHNTALSIYDLMRELNKESNIAFLVVTHDKELAAKMDRQMHMQDGLLVDRFVTDTASAEG